MELSISFTSSICYKDDLKVIKKQNVIGFHNECLNNNCLNDRRKMYKYLIFNIEYNFTGHSYMLLITAILTLKTVHVQC